MVLVELDLGGDATNGAAGSARVSVAQRADQIFVPHGTSILLAGDHLVVVFPNGCDLDDLDRWASDRHPEW